MQKPYSIEARSYDLLTIASHNFWVLRNSEDEVVAQLHGLATDRKKKCFKPIGFFSDQLGFYEFKAIEMILALFQIHSNLSRFIKVIKMMCWRAGIMRRVRSTRLTGEILITHLLGFWVSLLLIVTQHISCLPD